MSDISSACREFAREIRLELDAERKGHKSLRRMDITERLRSLSQQERTRIKSEIGRELDEALAVQGLAAFPRIADTSTHDWVRIYRLGKTVAFIIDLIVSPSLTGDMDLAGILTKIKRPAEPARAA